MKQYALLAFVGTLMIYAIFAFVQWNIDPSSWGRSIRVMFALFFLGWMSIAAIICAGIHDLRKS